MVASKNIKRIMKIISTFKYYYGKN